MYKIMKLFKTFSLKFLPEPNFTTFHVKLSIKGELKVRLNDHASVTKMASVTIDFKNHLKFSLESFKTES